MQKVAAVSGGFDPLHIGHLELIEAAAKYGKVVVLLNSDTFLMKKKGYVFMPLNERKRVLEAIRHVYKVIPVIDKDMTVCKTLAKLKPNYFINGGDRYNTDTIPETNICRNNNIQMVFTGQAKIQSSSSLCSAL